jgi:hypothetical protein
MNQYQPTKKKLNEKQLLVPKLIVRLDAMLLAMFKVQMRITEGIHGVFQGVVIVEKLQAARDGEYNFCARPHVQGMDSSWILYYVVSWFGNPVVSERERLLALGKTRFV